MLIYKEAGAVVQPKVLFTARELFQVVKGPVTLNMAGHCMRSIAATYQAAVEVPSTPGGFFESAEDLTAGNWAFYSTGSPMGIVGLWFCIDAQGWELHASAVSGKARSTSQMIRRQLVKEKSADCSTFVHLRRALIEFALWGEPHVQPPEWSPPTPAAHLTRVA